MSKKHRILTTHSKNRLNNRLNLSRKNEYMKLFNQAIQYGKSPHELQDGELKKYLFSKMCMCNKRGFKLKLYHNIVFIHKNKTLITVYELPKKFLNKNKGDRNETV